MRLFVEEVLPTFRAQNPHVAVEEVVRRYRHPMLVALYRNGRSKPVCVKNLSPKEVMEHVGWLRNSHGRGQEYQVVRSRHLSRAGSVQGQWGVGTFASQLEDNNRRRLAAAQRQISF